MTFTDLRPKLGPLAFSLLTLTFLSTSCGESEPLPTPETVELDSDQPTPEEQVLNAMQDLPAACSEPCLYVDSLVPLVTANQWMSNYRTAFPNAPLAFYYETDAIQTLLEEQPSDGLRMYFGNYEEEEGSAETYRDRMRLIMVPVKDTNDVVLPNTLGYDENYTFDLGGNNVLNGGVTSQRFESSIGSGIVSYSDAVQLASNWRGHQASEGLTLQAYTFCVDWLCGLLSEGENDPAIGVRFYVGLDGETDELHLVMVAVDNEGNDITRNENGTQLVDWCAPCPQICGVANELNGL